MNDSTEAPINPARTALVLGSSFLGVYAHAGFLAAFDEAGFTPGRIAGCSAGALAGAFHASGLRGDDLRNAALDSSLRLSFFDIGFLWRLPGVATSFWSNGIFTGKRTIAHLKRLLGERDLAELPLDIAVTHMEDSRAEIRRSGPLAELIMASCAVPGLFTIQEIGKDRYLDGGIANEHPFEQFVDDDSIDTIIIHRIRHEEGSKPTVNWETVSNVISMSHHAACDELNRLRSQRAEASGKTIIELNTTTPFPGLFSNKLAPKCHELGHHTAQQFLQSR